MEQIYNFRDFGGYATSNGRRIKTGVLYRSGNLAKASAHDIEHLTSLGIRMVCDLRTHGERRKHPDQFPDGYPVRVVHIPIQGKNHNDSPYIFQLASLIFGKGRRTEYAEALKAFYQEYITDFRAELSAILRLAAEQENLPLLIHCTAGKDRTGIACGLLHLLLGTPPEVALHDYLLSNQHLYQFQTEMLKQFAPLRLFGVSTQRFMPIFEARQEYWEAAFAQIGRDYGSADAYLRDGLGISENERQRFAALLLE
ncbi:possible protein-tyrosine-phosphatase [Candidatus Moduliflexus flocculans]|uniref:Possible protein-tyrosine-phosphatase n=1 Tax=Candidatus Moduliflexus flocculans TaxID=1499966 RepID=A0A0S6VWE0_9BACT|nr:possible protein-tyrosine-phosphatase [Candidatus Moduliflexus flocculans]